LPAELLTVNYAAEVRKFLMTRFGRVRLVLFKNRVFPGVLEEVLVLLADGVGPTDQCEISQVTNIDDLTAGVEVVSTWRPQKAEAKWMAALLPPAALDAYDELLTSAGVTTLQEKWGETTLGAVTGSNAFFTLSPDRARQLGLSDHELVRLSPPGSRHLRGLSFTHTTWSAMGREGAKILLFRPIGDPSAAALAYIQEGERLGIEQAYKCRVRRPWWRVPLVPVADLLLTYMNADTPRLATNRARVHHLNSVHGLYLREGVRRLGQDLLPLAALNSLTMLGAEMVGRAYGGGILKLEPREADVLPVPAPTLVETMRRRLTAVRNEVSGLLARGRLLDATRLVDQVLLIDALQLDHTHVQALADAHAMLTSRRMARGATRTGR
jgi:hypothetical protein